MAKRIINMKFKPDGTLHMETSQSDDCEEHLNELAQYLDAEIEDVVVDHQDDQLTVAQNNQTVGRK